MTPTTSDTKDWTKTVFIWLEGDSEAVPAGLLTVYEQGIRPVRSTFVYGNRYRERKNAISVDPEGLSLVAANRTGKPVTFEPPSQLALFGAIRDAAPDSWGRRVIENMVQAVPNSLPETDYLMHAGPHRTGALDFRDSPTAKAETGKLPGAKDLKYLLDASAMIQEGRPVPRNLEAYFTVGATFGGARPKAVLLDKGRQWLAKFPALNDGFNVPLIERATLELARQCGLRVPELAMVRLADGRDVMLIERFDRVPLATGVFARRHIVSALTMLQLHENDTTRAQYADLAEVLNTHGASGFVAHDKVELFRRMVFNILVSNDDDHLRNHAFVWEGARGGWRLSDLYDVVPKPQVASQRYLVLGVGRKGRLATLDNAFSAAGQFGIRANDAVAYINEIASVVREWRTYFDEFGVPQSECDKVASAFRNPKDIGLALLS
ncbi:type II toxin-antitoxin system HipA family toxin [Paraburkholderia phenazinium]|jgi:serine/threonine-protein kinase HipA|uniref:Serine/threonine-protein kinase HipA n=1 Tax=Paraburkholderia phenazinium TaxID=60549 RepID=A0A1N6FZA1_9BURK|nr:HipA domain-containing protein [Paraburkholderia phenazinium]SIO00593.1 serine/threonine-protein kinase HipA [Paraburkholderia phenazinium]